jgi:hypothetical protein
MSVCIVYWIVGCRKDGLPIVRQFFSIHVALFPAIAGSEKVFDGGLLDLQRRSRKLTGHVDITEIRVEVGQVCLFPVALNFNQQTIRCELLSCKGAPWHHVTFFVTRAVVEADNSPTCFAVTKAGGWWCKLRFMRRPPIVRRVFENSDGLRLAVTPSYHSSAVQKQTAQSMHVVASM